MALFSWLMGAPSVFPEIVAQARSSLGPQSNIYDSQICGRREAREKRVARERLALGPLSSGRIPDGFTMVSTAKPAFPSVITLSCP
jgi:hypothetical protein